jgi:hypothetical protein
MTRLIHPEANKVQQGSIFNNVVVPGYENCKCCGIVLTARCDLEHGKHNLINYLPVVRFTDWASRALPFILARRLRTELKNEITKALIKRGVSALIRETYPLIDVINQETQGSERATLLQKAGQLEVVARAASRSGDFCPETKEILTIAGKKTDKLVEELIQQKLGEYYFLEATDACIAPTQGHVVLLRNMQTMDCKLMERIVAGITSEAAQACPDCQTHLTFAHEPICLVTGVLRSPDVEHLAQQFATLFIRIGLEDQSEATILQHRQLARQQ